MPVLETHTVTAADLPCRLFDFVLRRFESVPSRSAAKKAIKRGEVAVDGQAAGEGLWLNAGQKVELLEAEGKIPQIFPLPLRVVLEDEHLAVVEKPPGIPVSGNRFKTVQNALSFNLWPSAEKDVLRIPRPVHRLDYATSGLLLVAKTARVLMVLGQQFENRQVGKRYRALVAGKTPAQGIIDSPVGGQPALSRYSLVKHGRSLHTEWISLLDLFPETGRTHQLRIHLAGLGFPILGDDKYGDVSVRLKGKGLFLSAVEISLRHPETGMPINCKIDQPEKFTSFYEREQKRWKKYFQGKQ